MSPAIKKFLLSVALFSTFLPVIALAKELSPDTDAIVLTGKSSLETAVAAGTLIHSVMWVTLTGLGLAVLRARHTPLAEVDRVAGGE